MWRGEKVALTLLWDHSRGHSSLTTSTRSNQHLWRSSELTVWSGEATAGQWFSFEVWASGSEWGIKWRAGSLAGGLRCTPERLVASWPVGSCSRHSCCYSRHPAPLKTGRAGASRVPGPPRPFGPARRGEGPASTTTHPMDHF